MKSSTFRESIIAAIGAALMLGASLAAAHQAAQPTLEGTWVVTRTGIDCVTGKVHGSFPAIMVFHAGGTYSGFPAQPGSTPADQSPEYGNWQRGRGAHDYTFRITGFGYDGGALAGTFEITGAAELSQKGDALNYTSSVQFTDPDGNPLFMLCGQATGVRFQ
jgi:Tfp pilus assembly protein PilX